MRASSTALTGLICTLLASSGCSVADMVGQEVVKRSTSFTVPIPEQGICQVQTHNGRVQCEAGEVTEIQVEAEITARGRTVARAEQFVDMITIDRAEAEGIARIVAKIPHRVPGSVSMKIIVPKNLEMRIKTTNGFIDVNGIENNTTARTSNGSVSVRECRGEIVTESSNGRIIIEGDVLTKVNAETSNGAIRIKGQLATGEHHAETSNGSIHVELSGPPVRITADTSNGRIRVNGRKHKRGKSITVGAPELTADAADPATGDDIARLLLDTSNGSIEVLHSAGVQYEQGDTDDEEEDDDDDHDKEDRIERLIEQLTDEILDEIQL